jgi:hypothetical protein
VEEAITAITAITAIMEEAAGATSAAASVARAPGGTMKESLWWKSRRRVRAGSTLRAELFFARGIRATKSSGDKRTLPPLPGQGREALPLLPALLDSWHPEAETESMFLRASAEGAASPCVWKARAASLSGP